MPPRLLEQLNDGSVACDKSSDMREFANKMYLLVILRFVFGGLSKTSTVIRSTRFIKSLVSKWTCVRAEFASVAPHEWMRMDYVLTEVRDGYVYCGRGTFKQANHPLRSLFWFCRRLAGRPEPYPTLAAAVCRVNSQPARR